MINVTAANFETEVIEASMDTPVLVAGESHDHERQSLPRSGC